MYNLCNSFLLIYRNSYKFITIKFICLVNEHDCSSIMFMYFVKLIMYPKLLFSFITPNGYKIRNIKYKITVSLALCARNR